MKIPFHKAWIVLIGVCLVQSGVLGIVFNCRGIFFDPVCNDLDFSLSSFTAYGIYFGLSTSLTMPFVSNIFNL